MAGYAYPVGATADSGAAITVTNSISAANTAVAIFTATKKTKVTSILLTNLSGGVLPVNILVNQGGDDLVIAKARVLTTKYAGLSLVSGDTRTTDDQDDTITEFILQTGDVLKASCPIEDVVNVTLNLTEGVK